MRQELCAGSITESTYFLGSAGQQASLGSVWQPGRAVAISDNPLQCYARYMTTCRALSFLPAPGVFLSSFFSLFWNLRSRQVLIVPFSPRCVVRCCRTKVQRLGIGNSRGTGQHIAVATTVIIVATSCIVLEQVPSCCLRVQDPEATA